ncbi:MAG TPA: EamA family transporter RarD, partial [Novosphingobium sp.]|nr:EamA family transporter RarD [Novosphingobium sp.]
MSPDRRPSGLPHALSAYVMWGLFPLWLMPIRHVPAWEAIGWRIVFTLPFCAVLLLVQRQTDAVRAVLADRRAVLALAAG